MVGMGCMNSSCFSLKRMVVFPAPSSPRVTTRISIFGPMWTRLSWKQNKQITFLTKPNFWPVTGLNAETAASGEAVYLSEGDRDASIQLNVVRQLSELVLLLLKRLQQTVDLLLCQHDSAVILQQKEASDARSICACLTLEAWSASKWNL